MIIYKILRADEWAALRADGTTNGAPVDVADGFIHFSTAQQAQETAAKHFAGAEGLLLLAYDTSEFGAALKAALKWETSRGGALFPHLYAPLTLKGLVWAKDIPLVDGVHNFPAEMTAEAS